MPCSPYKWKEMKEELKVKFMREAIALSVRSARIGGGPFGAVVVKDGKIIARGENRVVRKNDPTAHAEIIAIRQAASRLHTHDLTGCTMFSSSQPCPMCLAAIYWANMDAIYYAATCEDASSAGFRDEYLVYELKKEPEKREKPEEHMVSLRQEAGEAFRIWKEDENRKEY